MPAMLDDPASPPIYRRSGDPPFPTPSTLLPSEVIPRHVTLRDRVTSATLLPFSSSHQVPPSLLAYLCDQLNREIEKGDTYPMMDPMPVEKFGSYWFANFGAIMLLGKYQSIDEVHRIDEQASWGKDCFGSFYIKPNYPGRSSHVCNGGFLVTDAARNRGVGRLMGEGYLDWAPKFGYTYSVFNLVYETNVASCRIWDALGFKRIGRVKGCGNLRSYPDEYIDAIIYGRELGLEGEEIATEERFDKIRFYLKHGKYPNGADRAEKSRLRSAVTHYKLINTDGGQTEKLMLKDKEVVSDPQRQYEIATSVHSQHHGGINKTTASIAEKYHWVRIKETVSLVIRRCADCGDLSKTTSATEEVMRSEQRIASDDPNTMCDGGGLLSVAGQGSKHHQSTFSDEDIDYEHSETSPDISLDETQSLDALATASGPLSSMQPPQFEFSSRVDPRLIRVNQRPSLHEQHLGSLAHHSLSQDLGDSYSLDYMNPRHQNLELNASEISSPQKSSNKVAASLHDQGQRPINQRYISSSEAQSQTAGVDGSAMQDTVLDHPRSHTADDSLRLNQYQDSTFKQQLLDAGYNVHERQLPDYR